MSIKYRTIDEIVNEESDKKQILIVKKDNNEIVAITTENSIASAEGYEMLLNYGIINDIPQGILVYDDKYLIARILDDIKEVTTDYEIRIKSVL